MADSISIVMKMQDDISGKLKSIASTSKGCSKEFEALQRKTEDLGKRYDAFNKQSASLSAQAISVQKAMNEAKKAFKETQSEADRADYEKLKAQYDDLIAGAKGYSQAAKETIKDMNAVYQESRKLGDSGDAGGKHGSGFIAALTDGSLTSKLSSAGFFSMAGDAVAQFANFALESTIGQPGATFTSSLASGAASGAAAGMLVGMPGVGALIGGGIGAVSGLVGMKQQEDDAFKEYYKGLYEDANAGTAEGIAAGSATAGQRELDAIAFERLLGEEKGGAYLEDLRSMAAGTPMEYGDLTVMSRALATGFGDSPERMLALMTAIGDAGSAVGVTASDMTEMARAMSRMNSSGKATLEFLNIFQDRGVDVIGMLGEAMGKTQGEIYDMISRGQINGQDAADIIQAGMEGAYGGAMEVMAQTFSGLTSTLQDAMTEVKAAYGTGFNKERGTGLEAEIAAYGGPLGDALGRLNEVSGRNAAYGENLREQYTREALEALLLGRDTTVFGQEDAAKLGEMQQTFIRASAAYAGGDQKAGAKMEALKEQAEALAAAAFESSEWSQKLHDAEIDQIDATRELTKSMEAATFALETANAFTKGRGLDAFDRGGNEEDQVGFNANVHAFGLRYVPYDGYPAVLHQGERVLTAAEARERGGGGGTPVTITGNTFAVRTDADIPAIAEALADEIESRAMAYGGN